MDPEGLVALDPEGLGGPPILKAQDRWVDPEGLDPEGQVGES